MSRLRSGNSGVAPLPVTIVGKPDARSDAAITRLFGQWLQRQHPGTSWNVSPVDGRRST